MSDTDAQLRPEPDFLFETSWEVANMVGGIHTVLATKAKTMRERFGDDYVCIGPKLWGEQESNKSFLPGEMFPGINATLQPLGISVVTGRWNVPGEPRCILVDFSEAYKRKNEILEWLWLNYKVDSLTGGWDYVEPVMFGFAVGQVIEVCTKAYLIPDKRSIVAQWHEWMVGSGMLYLKKQSPEIASVFTTHATVLGRSVSSSGVSLAETMQENTPAQLAKQQNVTAKFSMESTLARESDCFTTVSEITGRECEHFFGRAPDVLVPNGIGDDYPPAQYRDPDVVSNSRESVFELAELVTGRELSREKTSFVLSAGRYEYVNKGLNLVVDALTELRPRLRALGHKLIAIMSYPTATTGPERELVRAKNEKRRVDHPRICTHVLQEADTDPLMRHLHHAGFRNAPDDPIIAINVPIYLDGSDPIVPLKFYELTAGAQLTLYPSAYEPWGYTPLESLAYSVPTVTSDHAGFGMWIESLGDVDPMVANVLRREGVQYEKSRDVLVDHIDDFLQSEHANREEYRREAWEIARRAHWSIFSENYFEAFRDALQRRRRRMPGVVSGMAPAQVKDTVRLMRQARAPEDVEPGPRMHLFTVKSQLPDELQGLRELANNLWWTWNPDAEALFRELSAELWVEKHRNPLKLLEALPQAVIDEKVKDQGYLDRMERVLGKFEDYMEERGAARKHARIAYFCMEYGLHESLPFYSGGLGVLAGDTMKTASDLKLPLMGVGLAYRRGSFVQKLDRDGNQYEETPSIDFTTLPMQPVLDSDGTRIVVYVRFPGRAVAIQAWRVDVGAVPLYLLDTDHPNNNHTDREITSVLYAGDREKRLQQEIVLGIGGSKLLRAIGKPPAVYHMNESHTAFLSLDRQFRLMREGDLDFATSFEFCKQTSVFTTHTPIPAGHETYQEDLLRPYLMHYQERLHRPWNSLMALGREREADTDADFSMSLMAIRNSAGVNGVSKVHRRVSQKMFRNLLPGFHESEVPIGAVTNGAHPQTWIAPEWQRKFDELIGPDWRNPDFDPARWDGIREIEPDEFMRIRTRLKKQLIHEVLRQVRTTGHERGESTVTLSRVSDAVRENALVVGFARRFVPYKRPTLLFRDMDSFRELIGGSERPLLFLFSGKAHPQDIEGKRLIRELFHLSRSEEFAGKVIFLEDYEMHIARMLVRGCDIWLNNPTRPLEASGTSGMKASMNGCLNLSVLDGWWAEGYHGNNGWAIEGVSWYDGTEIRHDPRVFEDTVQSDEADCERIHWLLKHEIVPLYFGEAKSTESWVDYSKEAMVSALKEFSAQRMMREYNEHYYRPALDRAELLQRDDYEGATRNVEANARLARAWAHVRILDCDVGKLAQGPVYIGDRVSLKVRLQHAELNADELLVELVTTQQDDSGHELDPIIARLQCREATEDGTSVWTGVYEPKHTGPRAYGVRVLPAGAEGKHGISLGRGLVHWA